VRNENGVSIITKVAIKQLHCIPITSWLKRLLLSKETTKQMKWHKEGKRESEDPDIMSHPTNSEVWHALAVLILNLHGAQGVFVLVCRWMVSNVTAPIAIRTLGG
jgi:hypothetical protein